ncbi:NapC/NirT family cytochrome c [Desulfosporosinus sp. FKA]|uniref:cytochrome c3 family protein n=1 Tax=Desulfosporosinus sp. FKA TaxID=1969834 RepID=UPI000B4A0401|nr:NapC/NirT family cytochrome c [Desulfosporosinus sp. FKA]
MAPNEGQPAKASKAQRTVLIGLLVLVVLLVGAYAGMHYTSRPQFCTSCHEIAPQVASWEKGPHKSVECLSCHAAPGNLGYIVRKVSSYKELYLHFTHQVPSQIQWTPHIDACLYCHSGKDSAYPNAKNITLAPGSAPNAPPISHQPMISGNVNCISCHGNVGHATPSASTPSTPSQ